MHNHTLCHRGMAARAGCCRRAGKWRVAPAKPAALRLRSQGVRRRALVVDAGRENGELRGLNARRCGCGSKGVRQAGYLFPPDGLALARPLLRLKGWNGSRGLSVGYLPTPVLPASGLPTAGELSSGLLLSGLLLLGLPIPGVLLSG
ncbi:hypothetical protein SODG_003737 [Sodalis praecaptivus]